MKDKIIEILIEELNREFREDSRINNTNDFYHRSAKRIDSLYPTINRDKVMEILTSKVMSSLDEIADALCSLSLPTLSEEEIEKAFYSFASPMLKHGEIKIFMGESSFKSAIKELTKPKEER
jgi:hypothetical protein